MGKYSSDSDSEKQGKGSSTYTSRNRRRSRSRSSSYKSKSRRRSRSKDRSSRHKHVDSRSRDRHRRQSRTRQEANRSRSKDYIKEYIGKKRSGSSSSNSSPEPKTKLNKGKCSSTRNFGKSLETEDIPDKSASKSQQPLKFDLEVLNEINKDSFVSKKFTSSTSKNNRALDKIVVDLKKQTIKVPEVEQVENDSIFHHNLFVNEEARVEKWIKELYGFRQKALQQGLKTGQ